MSDTGGTQFARGAVAVACADDGDFILLCADSVVLAVAQHNGGVLISSGKVQPLQHFADHVGFGWQLAVEPWACYC